MSASPVIPTFIAGIGTRDAPEPNWTRDFPVVGQGTIIFNIARSSDFYIYVRPKVHSDEQGAHEWISLAVRDDSATFTMSHNGETKELITVKGEVKNEPVGYVPDYKVAYWFSYNRDLLELKYGKGYYMEETTLMTYNFLEHTPPYTVKEEEKIRDDMEYLFSPYIRRRIDQYDNKAKALMIRDYAEKIQRSGEYLGERLEEIWPDFDTLSKDEVYLKVVELAKSMIDIEKKVDFNQNPFVTNWSPFVLDSSKINLFKLDSNAFTFSASLPPACLELYSNVTAPDVQLNWPNTKKYKLSDAIQHSIDDPNGILHNKLKSKTGEFGNPKQIYLRVTLGPDRGKSAGIPYVLEIWPSGCGSPIHNHGNCYAVINVVYGGLTIQVFNKHTRDKDSTNVLKEFDVKKGDCTWISPNWFQTHKLWNHNSKFCATIQCYQYSKTDLQHWPYFDYVTEENEIDEFRPDSDYTFHELEKLVMAEYTAYMLQKSKAK